MPTPDFTPFTSHQASRRGFLKIGGLSVAGLAAAGVLASCGSDSESSSTAGGSAAGLTALSVQLSWILDTEWAPFFIADDKGYFADNGVELNMTPGGADIGAVEGLVASGKYDLGVATDIASVVAAAADGNPLVILGALYQHNLNGFMSHPDKPITSMKDMIGKRVGGNQGVQTKFDAMFRLNGLEPDYTFVPIGYGPDALINGDCDVQSGFMTDEALAYETATGNKPALFTWDDAGFESYTLTIFTTKKTLEAKRDAIKGFLAGAVKGAEENLLDSKVGAKLAAEKYGKDAGLDLEEEQGKNALYVPFAESEGTKAKGQLWVDPERLAGPIFKAMEASDLKTLPVKDVLDVSLLEEIYKAG